MPGTPESVLGGRLASAGLASPFGVAAVAAVVWLTGRGWSARRTAGVVGAGYAGVVLVAWGVVSVVTGEPRAFAGEPLVLAGWLAGAAVVFALQVAVPAYALARWRLRLAWVFLFFDAFAGAYVVQFRGGESVGIAMWAVLLGPLLLAVTVLALGAEWLLRQVLA